MKSFVIVYSQDEFVPPRLKINSGKKFKVCPNSMVITDFDFICNNASFFIQFHLLTFRFITKEIRKKV